jgi:hypothetical protein
MGQFEPDDEDTPQRIADSTSATDTAVPDEQEPRIPGDSAILLGSEAATIDRNQGLTDEANGEPKGGSQAASRISRRAARSHRRGALRRR